jgi:hypothetical protein
MIPLARPFLKSYYWDYAKKYHFWIGDYAKKWYDDNRDYAKTDILKGDAPCSNERFISKWSNGRICPEGGRRF